MQEEDERGEEVSCADRNFTRMSGQLQALSHAALPGTGQRLHPSTEGVGAGLPGLHSHRAV